MLHPLLLRQLRRCGIASADDPPDREAWVALLDRISRAYREADEDRYLVERSLDTSSGELLELNASLNASKAELAAERDRLRHVNQVQEEMGRVARVGGWEYEPATGQATWTREMYEIFGLPTTHTPELGPSLLHFPGEGRRHVERLVQRAAEFGEPFDFTLPFTTADGRNLWVQGLGKAERRSDGSVRLYGAFMDVTESHVRSIDLAQAVGAAEDASRAKSEFLANMSHEIRTPMTAILGYADLLLEEDAGGADPHRLEIIHTIRSAGRHLLSVINDILDLSKIEADRMTVEYVEVPILRLLRDTRNLLRQEAESKGIRLEVALGSEMPMVVRTDPTRLRQILMNLAGNAVKFTDAGRVDVSVRAEEQDGDRRIVVDVADTGCGMTRDQADRLFATFSQADGSMTRRFGGTGLGLVICRRLARLMGGDVTLVRTEPGKGSCFRIDLPLVPVEGSGVATSLHEEAPPRPPAAVRSRVRLKGRILFAEDSPVNRRLVALHLRRAGAVVDEAEHGREALEMLTRAEAAGEPYDLLLTDMQMPEMDGYSLVRTLREQGSTLAIVALTAHTLVEDRPSCLEIGCDDYAGKPIDPDLLISICADWLSQAAQRSVACPPPCLPSLQDGKLPRPTAMNTGNVSQAERELG